MSEFRIVKCKKCDAALTEIHGQRLTACVQCGHSFQLAGKSTKLTSSKTGNKTFTPEIENLVKKLRQLKTNKTAKTTKSTIKKKNSNPIGTIIFLIILFNVLKGIFGN